MQKIKCAKSYPLGTLQTLLPIEDASGEVSEVSPSARISHSQGDVGEVAYCQTSQQFVQSWWVQPLAFLVGLGGKWVMQFELAKTMIFTLKGIFYSWVKANWNALSLGLFIQTRTMRSIFNRKWGEGREMAVVVIGCEGQSLKLNMA